MADLMNVLTLKATVHVMTGNDAAKKAKEWKRSFERDRMPKLIFVHEMVNSAAIFEIEHRDVATILLLAKAGEAQDLEDSEEGHHSAP